MRPWLDYFNFFKFYFDIKLVVRNLKKALKCVEIKKVIPKNQVKVMTFLKTEENQSHDFDH
jgi:hypothetical protein